MVRRVGRIIDAFIAAFLVSGAIMCCHLVTVETPIYLGILHADGPIIHGRRVAISYSFEEIVRNWVLGIAFLLMGILLKKKRSTFR